MLPGFGLLADSTGKLAANTAVLLTIDNAEQGPNYCESMAAALAYTCKLPIKALTAYRRGMRISFWADIACTGACSLNIDAQGIRALKLRDGTTDATFQAGPHELFFDGTVFRVLI